MDAVSHQWVASLANYNFYLHFQQERLILIQMPLLRVSWLGCMPNNLGTHLKVTAPVVWAVQEAALKGPTSPIQAYSCDLHVLDSVQDGLQVACMTMEDWCEAQQADLTLNLVITRLWMEPWVDNSPSRQILPELNQFLCQ